MAEYYYKSYNNILRYYYKIKDGVWEVYNNILKMAEYYYKVLIHESQLTFKFFEKRHVQNFGGNFYNNFKNNYYKIKDGWRHFIIIN